MKVSIAGSVWFAGMAIGVILMATAVWQMGLLSGPSAPSRPDFKGYVSTAKLNGAALQETELIRYRVEGLDVWYFDYVLHYDSGITVYERHAQPSATAPTCDNVLVPSTKYERICTRFAIADRGQYIVETGANESGLYYIGTRAQLGSTSVDVVVPKSQHKEFATYGGWQDYFDSLNEIDLGQTAFISKISKQGGG